MNKVTKWREMADNRSNTKNQMSPTKREHNMLENWTSEAELLDNSSDILQYTKRYLILMDNIRKTEEQDSKRTDRIKMEETENFTTEGRISWKP